MILITKASYQEEYRSIHLIVLSKMKWEDKIVLNYLKGSIYQGIVLWSRYWFILEKSHGKVIMSVRIYKSRESRFRWKANKNILRPNHSNVGGIVIMIRLSFVWFIVEIRQPCKMKVDNPLVMI